MHKCHITVNDQDSKYQNVLQNHTFQVTSIPAGKNELSDFGVQETDKNTTVVHHKT